MPRRANRMEKSVCSEKIVARILNLYIVNVSGRQGCRPLRIKRKRLFYNCSERRPRRSRITLKRCCKEFERRGRRSLQYYINVCFSVVGTRRAVSAVAIKIYRLNRSYREK